MLLISKATERVPQNDRRWQRSPQSEAEVRQLLSRLCASGDIQAVEGVRDLYRLRSPFSRSTPVEEYELIMELNPFASIAYASALEFHDLTDQFSNVLQCIVPAEPRIAGYPVGTSASDWKYFRVTRGRMPSELGRKPVSWHRVKAEFWLGVEEYSPNGYPVRVTSIERTLLDGLRYPALCGGFETALKAFILAADQVSVSKTTEIAEGLNIAVLRQRTGYVLDRLGIEFEARDRWKASSKRGGSSKLCPDLPFAPDYSEDWNLSVNYPVESIEGWPGR